VPRATNTGPGRPAKDPNSKTQLRNAKRTAEGLRDDAKAFRDRFVFEYLKDFSNTYAYIRAGGTAKRPSKAGYDIRHEAYVVQQIQESIERLKPHKMVSQQTAISWMIREANHVGGDSSHGARVSAIAHVMKAQGMSTGEKEVAAGARGGVMVVPATENLLSWEQRSATAQALLKEQVRN